MFTWKIRSENEDFIWAVGHIPINMYTEKMWSTINWFESLDISLLSQQQGHNWTPRKMSLVMSKET